MRLSLLLSIILITGAMIACSGGRVTRQANDGFVQQETVAKADTAPEQPAQQTLIAAGAIASDGRSAQGAAAYARQGNVTVLLLRKFGISLVPGTRIALATGTDAKSIVSLGQLSAGAGDQQYSIPAGTDLSRYNTVIFTGNDGTLYAHAAMS